MPLFTLQWKEVKWIFGEILQNTKLIALLFGENGLIFATLHSTIKRSQIDFWSNFGKIPCLYSLTFWRKWANFCHFSLYNQGKSNWFLVKFRQNTKPIALHFGKNWPIYATFHSTIKRSQMDFWLNSAKYQAYSLTFWRKLAKFRHFSLYNKMKSNGFLVKFRKIPIL